MGGFSTYLHSDTLWGMLCWGIRYLWGESELTKFIDACDQGRPEFVISSTFPFKQHGRDKIPFFPNPLAYIGDGQVHEVEDALVNYRLRKKIKQIHWLSLDDFNKLLQGDFTIETILQRVSNEYDLKKQAFDDGMEYFPTGHTVYNAPPVFESNSVTHNTIDRIRGGTLRIVDPEFPNDPDKRSGQLFHAEEFFWTDTYAESDMGKSNTGLFFLADGNTEKIEAILRLFRHLGFGADRTAGKGFFDFEINDFSFKEPDKKQSTALINLSLFRPTKSELDNWQQMNGCLQYRLERREGFVGGYRELRRKQPRLYFKEGSIFKKPADHTVRFMGGVQPQEFDAPKSLHHKVWENGFGFMVNLNWKI